MMELKDTAVMARPVATSTAVAIDSAISTIKNSGLFDAEWYNDSYHWIAGQGVDLVEHYCTHGERNSRQPNQYFDPKWYRARYLADDYVGLALVHYIEHGRFQAYLPGPDFDAELYCQCFTVNAPVLEDALAHWVSSDRQVIPPINEAVRLATGIESSGLFLEQWYRETYADVDASMYSPIEHYVNIGFAQHRKPNPYFDSAWYLRANPHVEKSGDHPLMHYAMHGWRNGKSPSLRFTGIVADSDNNNREPLNDYLRVVLSDSNDPADCSQLPGSRFSIGDYKVAVTDLSAGHSRSDRTVRRYLSEPGFRLLNYLSKRQGCDKQAVDNFSVRLTALLREECLQWLLPLGRLETFASLYFPPVGTEDSVLDHFLQFLETFASLDHVSSPFFDAAFYREQTGTEAPDSVCLRKWIEGSDSTDVVPTAIFQPAIYAAAARLNHTDPVELYRHFLAEGLFAERNFHEDINVAYIRKQLDTDQPGCFAEYLLTCGVPFDPKHTALYAGRTNESSYSVLREFLDYKRQRNLRGRISGGALHDQIVAASLHDSKILRRGLDIPFSCPPFNMVVAPVVKNIRLSVAKQKYDSVLLIPHCRMSGATKIAGYFSTAMAELGVDDNILLVLTDLSINEHPEWFSDAIDTLDFASLCTDITGENRELALLDLIIGVQARRVINFNSRLGWQVYEKYGARLATQTDLHSYMYCYDLNEHNVKVGYPSEFFVSTFSHLKSVFLDSDYLRCELTEKNRLMAEDRKRLVTLYTPVQAKPQTLRAETTMSGTATVFWAGRLDRQKNFDLVVRIAREMSDVDFQCWGETVLGDFTLEELPDNVSINKPYQHIDELDFNQCDLWLYTALWDGIPNMILEVGARKVPLVTSVVWGIGDVVDEESGWTVTDIDNEAHYVQNIRSALADRTAAAEKAECLFKKINARHNMHYYSQSVGKALYE